MIHQRAISMAPNLLTTASRSPIHCTSPFSCHDTVASIRRIFNARSIAVVGASGDPVKFGYMTLDCLIGGGYDGAIFPVNPKGGHILGLKVYPSVSDIPGHLDLVLIIVPFQFVAGVLEAVSQKGAAGAAICSGGFREAGRPDLEQQLREIGQKTGLRLLGPNISGIAYLPNKMCAQFFPALTMAGPLAVVCQSGTVTTGLCEWATAEGIGVAAGINLGNQVDLCECDYLDFFAQDKNIQSIVMYLEGVSVGRRFLDTLSRTTLCKPVVIYKKIDRQIKAGIAISYFAGGGREKLGRPALSRAGFPVFAAPDRAIRGIGAQWWRANYLHQRE